MSHNIYTAFNCLSWIPIIYFDTNGIYQSSFSNDHLIQPPSSIVLAQRRIPNDAVKPSSIVLPPTSFIPLKDNDCLLHLHLLRPTSFSRYFYLYCASFSFSYFVLFVFHAVDNYNSFGTSSPSMGTSDIFFFVIHHNLRGGAKGFQIPHIVVNLFNITRWKVL